MKAEIDNLGTKHEKNVSIEKENVRFLEEKLDETLNSNKELRSKLETTQEEYGICRQEIDEGKIYIDGLKSSCSEMQEKLYEFYLLETS